MSYKNDQKNHGEKMIQEGFFNDDVGGGVFMGKTRPFVLQDGLHNIYPDIRAGALDYFKLNNIAWWSGYYPTGHVLSSQIACLNHLFSIRHDRKAVLDLLKAVSDDFVDVMPINEHLQGYIQFEAVGGDKNFLNETVNTRGSNCTSLDALIYALHKNGERFLIPIEWKYVEAYGNDNKSLGTKGETRKARYLNLIENSKYLNEKTFSCCWFEPFYQLMRQTLWVEQVLLNKVPGLEADDYLHIHVIPDQNAELLDKLYPCSEKAMKETWKSCLTEPDKYVVVSPKKLWSRQNKDTSIFHYLSQRYW